MSEPKRPAITPAQLVAVLIAGVPAVAKLLAAFSVYTLTTVQQAALTDALTWLGVLAGLLVVSDAGLRSARNAADAKTAVATLQPANANPAGRLGQNLTVGQPNDLSQEIPGGGEIQDGTRA